MLQYKEKFKFAVVIVQDDLDIAMSWVEANLLTTGKYEAKGIEVGEKVGFSTSHEVLCCSAHSEQIETNERRQHLLASNLTWFPYQFLLLVIKFLQG